MKPVHERNQECLPPKKRDLLVNNNNTTNNNSSSSISGMSGGTAIGSGGGEEAPSLQSSGTSGEPHSGGGTCEWVRAQPSMHFGGVEGPEGLVGLTLDQYSMLYKVALPAGTYSPTSLHPVLSHISPAYTVPSQVLQHTSVPYPPLGYTQIPHSSLQFVSSPYATAVPYAVPPGFVQSSLIPPQSAIQQQHTLSHLIPYPSVIQEGVVSSPLQQQVSSHVYTKMAAPSRVPLVLPSEQAAAQPQLGTVGMLHSAEVSPRGVFHHPAIRGVQPQRDLHSSSLEQGREVNGGDREHGVREPHQDAVSRNAWLLQGEPPQDNSLKGRRQEGRVSPGQRSTPDTDLEVQQAVGRLTSPVHGTSRKEAAQVPLNLSQRSRESQGEARTAYTSHPAESRAQQQQIVQPGHAVILANGQPVLVPLDFHHHQQQQQQQLQQQQQHYPNQPNNVAATFVASPTTFTKAVNVSAAVSFPERAVVELTHQQGHPPSQQLLAPATGGPPQSPLLAPVGPSHFMKGAIIQLATGELKRVEDLQTQDFVRSAEVSGGLKIDSSMVVDIRASQQRPGLVALHFNVGEQQSKVTIDVPPEHPFFVFGQGWSSCSPEWTAQLYGLTCHHLQVGDVCVSVTLAQQAAPQQKPSQQQQVQARTPIKANSTSGAPPQPMGPPAPQNTRPQSQLKVDRIHRERDRDKEEPMQVGGSRHADMASRPNRTSAEHIRSQSNYYLHTEGHGAGASSIGASQRRWSAPGFQRYSIKNEEGNLVSVATSGSSRPSFIPQEVKLSIEGRSNAGK
ncbi:ataxin-1-like [Xyrauchen texanus]|uniref:ataxin-1-like n=1 Tax=Xyrauchen texanus TaxID=154827 RepID=UPI002241D9D4|nr:ataxin-1-like [Xyrauchen texanus]